MGKKTIISIILAFIFIISATILFVVVYQEAREQYTDGHADSRRIVLENDQIKSIDTIETFNGKVKYHVMSGMNADNEKIYIWVDQSNKNKEIVVKKQAEGISKEEAVSIVKQENVPTKIIDINLGMDEGIPIWEIKYRDDSNRYTFDHVDFLDGDIIKHMAIKNSVGP